MAIDLLSSNTASEIESGSSEIGTAAAALREKFFDILKAESILPSDLSEATAVFFFQKGSWPSSCYVRVTEPSGREFEVAVDAMGNPAEIIDNSA